MEQHLSVDHLSSQIRERLHKYVQGVEKCFQELIDSGEIKMLNESIALI